jgi:hypothetical protein
VRVLLGGALHVDERFGDAALGDAGEPGVGADRAGEGARQLPGLGEGEQLVGLLVAALDPQHLGEAGAGGGEEEVGADGFGVLHRGGGVKFGAVEVAEYAEDDGADAEEPGLVGLGDVPGQALGGLFADLLEGDGVGDGVPHGGAIERAEGAEQPCPQVRRDIHHVDYFPGSERGYDNSRVSHGRPGKERRTISGLIGREGCGRGRGGRPRPPT